MIQTLSDADRFRPLYRGRCQHHWPSPLMQEGRLPKRPSKPILSQLLEIRDGQSGDLLVHRDFGCECESCAFRATDALPSEHENRCAGTRMQLRVTCSESSKTFA